MTPQEALDRIRVICDNTVLHDFDGFSVVYAERIYAILADVQPEQGITLNRGEAALAATWADCTVDYLGPHPTAQGAAFAARLDAYGRSRAGGDA